VIDKNSWLIGHADWPLTKCDYSSGYESIMANERLKEAAWKNIKYCTCCNKKCCNSIRASVFGKEFDKVCWMCHIQFLNPDADAIELAKKIIEKRCANIYMALKMG